MKKLLCLLLICSIFTLTSCNIQTIDQQGELYTEGYPKTVDNYGRQVTVNNRPQKVLTLGPNCTELFVALGLEEYVIGKSLVNHSRGPLPQYTAAVNNIPQLNFGSATREAVLSSGADFIYAIDWEISDQGVNIEEASQYGISVYVNSATTLDQQYKEILDIGTLFAVEENAESFIKDQKDRIAAVEEKLQGQQPLKVLIYDSGNSGVFTCSGNNFESLLIEKAGGKNIFSDITDKQWITVSYEEVLKRNPDIIVIHDYNTPSVDEKIAEIKANPSLAQLDCVKNNHFVTITLESVLPGNRMAYAVESFAKGFYPHLFE